MKKQPDVPAAHHPHRALTVDIANRSLDLASLVDTMLRQLDTLLDLQDQVATARSPAGTSSLPTRLATDLPMDSPSSMGMAGTRHTLPPAGQEVIRPMDSRRHRRVIRTETDVKGC